MTEARPEEATERRVEMRGSVLEIDGAARVIVCASLFPFRIPREQWEERVLAVRALGYHCLDVYVPWNHHESADGRFSFDGHRDLPAFLGIAHRHGLMVLLRPGPYICSEFDGGALPARLATIEGLRPRQNEPLYLAEVTRWFDAVLPLIAERQWTRGGPVILVQLENELDFFDCDDPTGYVEALRDLALRHGVEVPLVSCAGQGDVDRAGGGVHGVLPAVNLYPDDESTDVASVARRYVDHLRSRNVPALVTETNRRHRTLKRLLASGVVFLGPYLQAGGWNFDDDGATNNWGAPIGFMTSDYDFGGAIAPDGTERAEAGAARLLTRLVDALGDRLARAVPDGEVEVADGVEIATLALHGGGTLSSVTNLSGATRRVSTGAGPVVVTDGESRLILADLPLGGARLSSTGELWDLVDGDDLQVTTQCGGEQTVTVSGVSSAVAGEGELDVVVDGCTWTVTGRSGTMRATLRDGRPLTVTLADATAAAAIGARTRAARVERHLVTGDGLKISALETVRSIDLGHHDEPVAWEDLDVARGFGSYGVDLPESGYEALLLAGAGDVVSVHGDGRHTDHIAVGGQDVVVPWPATGTPERIEVRTITWGHSNFDDARLPSLALASRRGLAGAAVLRGSTDVGGGWSIASEDSRARVGGSPAPLADFGGWSTSIRPLTLCYSRDIRVPSGHDVAVLTLDGLETTVDVSLDGRHVGMATPHAPTVRLRGAEAGVHSLELRVTRAGDEAVGRPTLSTGTRLTGWRIRHTGDAELHSTAAEARASTAEVVLPLRVPAGSRRWLTLDLRDRLESFASSDILVRFNGDGLLVRALANGRGVGRVWTSPPPGATLKGGRGDIALIPAPWAAADPTMTLLLEAAASTGGVLRSLVLSNEIDLQEAR